MVNYKNKNLIEKRLKKIKKYIMIYLMIDRKGEIMEIRDYKKIAIIALCISVIGLSIAFAAISTTLYINGTTMYSGNEWNIHFSDNDKGTATGTADKGKIELTGTVITIYDVVLNGPGDTVTYTFDIVNSGRLDAKLETFYNWSPIFSGSGSQKAIDEQVVRNNFNYVLTYEDGTPLNRGDIIEAGKRKRAKLILSYNQDVSEATRGEVAIIKIGSTLVYVQK